jgi:hypothetical protein
MTNRLYDLITRFVALSLVVAVVGVTTIALVAASAAESPHGAEGNGIFYDNVVLDALVAPDSAAVTLFGVAFLVIGLMRQKRAI